MKHQDFINIESEPNGTTVLHAMCCGEHAQHRPVVSLRTAIKLGARPDFDTGNEVSYVIIDDCQNLARQR